MKKQSFDPVALIDEYLHKKVKRSVKENSNQNFSVHNLSHHIAARAQEQYWLDKIYTPKIRKAHESGDIRIHNLGYLSVYCVGWSLRDVLAYGYTGAPNKASFKPAKHFDSAMNQLTNFLYTLRYEADGAQAVSSVDTYLAPFIREDGLDYEQVKQNVQEFVYNLNIPLDKGFQAPFTNVTLDIKPTGKLAKEPVIIGGKPQKETYGEFQKEIYMFNRAFAEVMMEGDSKGRVFTWPIPTYNLTDDFPWDDEELEPIWEMTAKYGIPYFANFMNSDIDPDDVRSMCCRLRIDNRELRRKGGSLFGSDPLTGSIGIVTINLPRIGYLAKSEKEFFKRLDELLEISKESLELKREAIENFMEHGLYPYSKFYLRQIKERFGKYWKNHFNTIGIIGMNETLLNFFDKDILDEKAYNFAIKIMDHIRDRLVQYQEETDNMFNLEATPGETTAYYFARTDKEKYPDIITANELGCECEEKDSFYTNSTNIPVHKDLDIFEALDHQEELLCKYTGGSVFHTYLGEKAPSKQSVKKLVKKIASRYKIPYFSITPTFSVCPNHGYIYGEHYLCPKCKPKKTQCEVYSRVVGYISPVQVWNNGKKSEWHMRKTFLIHKTD